MPSSRMTIPEQRVRRGCGNPTSSKATAHGAQRCAKRMAFMYLSGANMTMRANRAAAYRRRRSECWRRSPQRVTSTTRIQSARTAPVAAGQGPACPPIRISDSRIGEDVAREGLSTPPRFGTWSGSPRISDTRVPPTALPAPCWPSETTKDLRSPQARLRRTAVGQASVVWPRGQGHAAHPPERALDARRRKKCALRSICESFAKLPSLKKPTAVSCDRNSSVRSRLDLTRIASTSPRPGKRVRFRQDV